MLVIRRIRSARSGLKTLSTKVSPLQNEEYTEKPEYPEIIDTSAKARRFRKRLAWHEKIKGLKTIEEKLIEINMPRYYGYKTIMFTDEKIPYNSLPITQHYTRTLFEEVDKLPESYNKNEAQVDSFAKSIRSGVEDALAFTELGFREQNDSNSEMTPDQRDRFLGSALISQLNRTLINALLADCSHLQDVEIDLDPRHEAFWFVGGVTPPEIVRKMRKGCLWQKDMIDEPVDRAVQYLGVPYVAVRHKLPLRPIVEGGYEDLELAKTVPRYPFDSRVMSYNCTHRHGTNIPGFWPGDSHEFGLLSYLHRDYLINRNPSFGVEDNQEALHAQGIQSSFAWLLGQACYQGFSTFNDLTYPLATQTIISNGKHFSFYVYQMNTSLVHCDQIDVNPRVNQCWGTKEMKLYEEIDSSGKIIGFNDEVLKHLIQFYANQPSERVGVDMKPYLGKDVQKVADITDDKRRDFLERIYKHLVANRSRHREIPEIYMWERIYKINNNTRPLEPKRRFFELGINPYKRRLDEHHPVYIPKVVRPEGPKSKNKWEKAYYP